ncbi:hypothetical protein [Streptomyces formicae]|uniref:Uncharacterized protein n=1 Tax=Streptomyces formicae TaxID=1616117 RepID=A0ABY3WM43_9ACTN|nr:hypothetical protein [Streptomyces formicae]UNM13713.1 hypothetical protein J4032_21675 [Streptomyces formicae]
MTNPLVVSRILGDQPFAEIGGPQWAVADMTHGCVIAAGALGHVDWRGRGSWKSCRIGVYEAADLRPRHIVPSRYPVCAIAVHPSLPLAAIGTGRYDGTWDFEGQLLLLHLETGRVTDLLSKSRQVRHLRWLDDGRLAMLISPEDKDGGFSQGFELAVEATDWLSAPAGLVDPDAVRHPMVESGLLHDPHAEVVLRDLARTVGAGWERRAGVRAVAALRDGRVLSTGRFTDLECRLPSGALQWSLPAEGEGSVQLEVSPGEESAWVSHRGYRRDPVTGELHARAPLVHRVATATGDRVDTVELGFGAVLASNAEGWVVLRDPGTPPEREEWPTVLLTPTHQEQARLKLPRRRSGAPTLRIRHSERLIYLDCPRPPDGGEWICAIEPPGAHGPARLTPLFPLRWDPASDINPWSGPGIELTDDSGTALVHAGRTFEQGATYRDSREGTCVVRRHVPDGTAAWVHTSDLPLADVDGDRDTVYVAYRTGEVEALDPATGTVRWRHQLLAHGHAVTPLCVTYDADRRRLLVGTVDGRILDCSVEDGSW